MAPWGWIHVDPKHVGVKWILHDFNVFFNKYVHELVTIDTNKGWFDKSLFKKYINSNFSIFF